ncbi:SCO0930 family lipoprotein [Streptomyces mexicanus]|uniref:SCO0930 family lipoprotein n=1 Tax=Streptomyces mexicanus TaxID=178566 RepID=UPI00135749BC|nr:SCO0930 family lipoprotein [Streptomyces mexicanus]
MNTSWRSASLVATAAAVLALTTACGQDGTSAAGSRNVAATAAADGRGSGFGAGSGAGTRTGTDPGTATDPGTGSGSGTGNGYGADGRQDPAGAVRPAGRLAVADNPEVGKVVTDSAGMTLYRFDRDTAEPAGSHCDGDCATTWPPVPAGDATAGTGIDQDLLGSVTRADGTRQLTVGGWPAYRYAKDTRPGQVAGQGVGGTWSALAPTGKKASPANLPGLSVRRTRLGNVVVDRNGMTVYRFLKDRAWPKPVSACTGACLTKWPAVAPVAADDTDGVVRKGLMGFTRPDGVRQMTVDCWPVYTFSGDKAPGDTAGQGVGGTWYAVAPDGKALGAPKK